MERTASHTQFQSLFFVYFRPQNSLGVLQWRWRSKPGWVFSEVWIGNFSVGSQHFDSLDHSPLPFRFRLDLFSFASIYLLEITKLFVVKSTSSSWNYLKNVTTKYIIYTQNQLIIKISLSDVHVIAFPEKVDHPNIFWLLKVDLNFVTESASNIYRLKCLSLSQVKNASILQALNIAEHSQCVWSTNDDNERFQWIFPVLKIRKSH